MNKIGVFCSSSEVLAPALYEQARQLGQWIGSTGRTLVYGGNRKGLMEAVAQGVRSTDSINVIGVVPKILIDRGEVSECVGIRVPTEGLSDRKALMMKISDVFVVMPGGIGTLDEAFSVMAESAIGISTKKVIFWNIDGFWDSMFATIETMKAAGAMNKSLDSLMQKADTLEELTALLAE